jgi:hypothetical protein
MKLHHLGENEQKRKEVFGFAVFFAVHLAATGTTLAGHCSLRFLGKQDLCELLRARGAAWFQVDFITGASGKGQQHSLQP